MNKLIVEFNKFNKFGNEPIWTIKYENPLFITDIKGKKVSLDDLSNNKVKNMMNELVNDFNNSNLEEYVDNNDIINPERVVSITASDYNIDNNSFTILVNIKGEPTEEEIAKIEDYIEGQCSDGWGEGFEQTETEGYYISTWSIKQNKKIKFIDLILNN